MTQQPIEYVTVTRYCAIEGIRCEKRIPFQGAWTFFFAYPSHEKWRDFAANLVGELAPRGIQGQRWEDVVKAELLFSKICEGIYGHDLLLAEVSTANPNVLLEVGYALAVGRQPILLIDKTLKPWNRRLLTTLESCPYESRDDILTFMSKLQATPQPVSPAANRRLPLLEKTGIYDREEIPGTVYHLRPKTTPGWVRRVDQRLKASFFKPAGMDPSDSVYDEFFVQARKIKESHLIIASLLSSEQANSDELNANVALLIGFAIGLGKPVLVLQQSPAAPILDLGTVLRTIETESQADQVVEAWLTQHTKELVSQKTELRRQAVRHEKAERIRGMYLGHPDALQDINLLTYFISTKEYEDALNARRTLFVGRKGTGKSANLQKVVAELSRRRNTVLVEIAPEDFQLERLSGFLEDGFTLADPKFVYQTVWNYVLLSEIIKVLAQKTDRLYVSPSDQGRTSLYEFYQRERTLLDLDFGSRLIAKLREISAIPADLSKDAKREKVEATIQSVRDYQIARRLHDFAAKEHITYFVIVDDLDKHWRPDSTQ